MNIGKLARGLGFAFVMTTISWAATVEQPQRSEDEIRKQVAALSQDDVPWRKIEWRTCLLDGIQASREQGKPLVLWVFIDRPIDDERC